MNQKGIIKFSDAYFYDEDCLLFANWNYNGLYTFNIVTGKLNLISYLTEIEDREYDQYQMKNIIQKDNTIFLFMYCGINVYAFDKDSLQMKVYSVNNEEDQYCSMSLALTNRDKIWRIPENGKGKLYSFDLNQKCFTKHTSWEEQIRKYIKSEDDVLTQTPFIADDVLWTCIIGTSTVLRYNLKNEEMSYYRVNNAHVTDIYLDNGVLWISQDNQIGVLKYDIEKNICQNFVYENMDFNGRPFSRIIVYKDYVILLPRYYDKILFFNKVNEEFYYICDDIYNGQDGLSARYGSVIMNDRMYLFPWGVDSFLVINMNNLKVEQSIKISAPIEDYGNLITKKFQNNHVIDESAMSLSEFLCGVKVVKFNEEISDTEAGSRIYKEINNIK